MDIFHCLTTWETTTTRINLFSAGVTKESRQGQRPTIATHSGRPLCHCAATLLERIDFCPSSLLYITWAGARQNSPALTWDDRICLILSKMVVNSHLVYDVELDNVIPSIPLQLKPSTRGQECVMVWCGTHILSKRILCNHKLCALFRSLP